MIFMIILILSDNLVQIFIGWEGVGIISFVLINFWYLRLEANKGALKALVFNRIGDFGYIGILIFILITVKTTNLGFLLHLQNSTYIIICCLLLAVFGKSAQLLLYAWLPDAMEGPTPVSSLLHSATMVTAGVYLLLRMIPILFVTGSTQVWLYIIIIITGLTSIFCGFYAFTKFDIKKIIAFSTCSQLGLMLCTIAFGYISGAFFHLFIHAFFKALLFVSSGIIIHSLSDEQDIRKYGMIAKHVPVFYLILILGSINIMGLFFFSGFYSKEFILLSVTSAEISILFKSFVFISSLFTLLYSIRLVAYNNTNFILTSRQLTSTLHSLDKTLLVAIIMLSFPAVIIGYFFSDQIIGFGMLDWKTLNIISNFFQIELASSSILFLFFYLCVFLLFLQIFLKPFSKSYSKISYLFFVFLYNLNQELQIQAFYWGINYVFNIVAYQLLIKIVERTVLDGLSFFGLLQLAYNVLTKDRISIKGNLHSFFLQIILFSCVLLVVFLFFEFAFLTLIQIGLLYFILEIILKKKL
jgi:NADH:ubiquinone oxidoreductase subunit 5 (subunit L)/multisubunit Na+/H+ antiporter MnhA subunit